MWLLLTVFPTVHLLLGFEIWEFRQFWSCCLRFFILTCQIRSRQSYWYKLLNLPRQLLVGCCRNPKSYIAFLVCVWQLLKKLKGDAFRQSALTKLSSMNGVVIVKGGILLSPSRIIIVCFFESWMSEGQLLDFLGMVLVRSQIFLRIVS